MEQVQKILRLKYGEYYSLKRTDRSKNIINNVEFTPKKVTSEQVLLSTPYPPKAGTPEEEVVIPEHCREMTEEEIEALKNGMTDQQKEDEEFYTWTYVKLDDTLDESNTLKNTNFFIQELVINAPEGKEITKFELKCEFQLMSRRKFNYWLAGFIGNIYLNETYSWSEGFVKTSITPLGLTSAKISIAANNDRIRNYFAQNKRSMEYHILAWRYKLTGGEIKLETQEKVTELDYDSQNLRGKHSYTYPESTLLTENAKLNGELLYEQNMKHILSTYKAGRETVELSWQGDPTLTIGDILEIENKMGIAQRYMVTGNKFDLNNNGKFSMTTQGISLI